MVLCAFPSVLSSEAGMRGTLRAESAVSGTLGATAMRRETSGNHTRELIGLGQTLWLDNISRTILDDGTLARYVHDFHISGLTSNPSIFEKAIGQGTRYDEAIRHSTAKSIEAIYLELALDDLRQAARLFGPVQRSSHHAEGWVSLEVSPLLADDSSKTIAAVADLHCRAVCKNFFIKIPGTPAGMRAIEESLFAGIPINVTLLFSREQYRAAAEAWMRAIERRIQAGLDPHVESVASLFVSRWDLAVNDRVSASLRNYLGIAVARHTYRAYRDLLESPRTQALIKHGARPQRLLWASTGTKDPGASDTLYVEALAAPDTINTLPDKTLQAFADHGTIVAPLARDGGDADRVLAEFAYAHIDLDALAQKLQRDGVAAFVKSWHALLNEIENKRVQRRRAIAS
jgi:transaldolase